MKGPRQSCFGLSSNKGGGEDPSTSSRPSPFGRPGMEPVCCFCALARAPHAREAAETLRKTIRRAKRPSLWTGEALCGP